MGLKQEDFHSLPCRGVGAPVNLALSVLLPGGRPSLFRLRPPSWGRSPLACHGKDVRGALGRWEGQ